MLDFPFMINRKTGAIFHTTTQVMKNPDMRPATATELKNSKIRIAENMQSAELPFEQPAVRPTGAMQATPVATNTMPAAAISTEEQSAVDPNAALLEAHAQAAPATETPDPVSEMRDYVNSLDLEGVVKVAKEQLEMSVDDRYVSGQWKVDGLRKKVIEGLTTKINAEAK
jgi:hypothetical protein